MIESSANKVSCSIYVGIITGVIHFVLLGWVIIAPHLHGGTNFLVLFKYIVFGIFTSIGTFILISWNRIIFSTLTPLLFLISAFAAFFVFNYNISIHESTISALFESSSAEAKGMLSASLIAWCSLSIAISIGLVKLYSKKITFKSGTSSSKSVYIYALSAAAIFLINRVPVKMDGMPGTEQFLPVNYIMRTINYIDQRAYVSSVMHNKKNIQDLYPLQYAKKEDELVVVMVIGDSLRPGHLSVNGYLRDTTPLLKNKTNMVSFNNAVSCSNLSRESIPCMLTRATSEDKHRMFEETSLIMMFQKAGFSTYFFNINPTYGEFDTPILTVSKEAKYLVRKSINTGDIKTLESLDTDILPYLDNFLKDKGDKLIILVTAGSHWKYNLRYPPEFKIFKPICNNPLIHQCPKEHLINSYDNTVYFFDYFIDQIFKRLESRNSMLFYASDNGESLGENGIYMHGDASWLKYKEQTSIAMLWWASDSYLQNNLDILEKMKKKSKDPVSHNNLFHSLLDCAGIDSEVIDKKLSLCSAEYYPTRTPYHNLEN